MGSEGEPNSALECRTKGRLALNQKRRRHSTHIFRKNRRCGRGDMAPMKMMWWSQVVWSSCGGCGVDIQCRVFQTVQASAERWPLSGKRSDR